MAQAVYDEAGAALARRPLYVAPEAADELGDAALDRAAEQEVVRRLEAASTPVYVAILPAAAAGDDSASALYEALRQPGTYLVLSGDLRGGDAGSTVLRDGASDDIAGRAFAAAGGDLAEFLVAFVEDVEAAVGEGAAAAPMVPATGEPAAGPGGGLLLPVGVLVTVAGGGLLLARRARRARERAALATARPAIEEDITEFGEEIAAVDLNARFAGDPAVRQEYDRALDLYEKAKAAAAAAQKQLDLAAVTEALEEGRWHLAVVRARLAGEPLPERRLPCFFDPRHGPSVEDVAWAPPGGAVRTVPACAADAVRLRDGDDPDVRTVSLGGGERRPYYDTGPAFAGWAHGYYGGFLPAMLVGTMLGTSFGAGPLTPGGFFDEGRVADGGTAGDAGGGGFGGFDGGSGGFGD